MSDEWTDEEWGDEEWFAPDGDEPPAHPRWRRHLIAGVGALVAAAMLAVPVWNVVDGLNPPVADSGLEICGFDYCVVQEAMREAGHDLTMSKLTNTILDEEQAQELADALVERLGVAPVTVEVVDRIEGRIAGQFEPETRHIVVQRPARAWIVLHEVAHTMASGHGEDFRRTLIELSEWMESTDG